jgi:hypothetical protein
VLPLLLLLLLLQGLLLLLLLLQGLLQLARQRVLQAQLEGLHKRVSQGAAAVPAQLRSICWACMLLLMLGCHRGHRCCGRRCHRLLRVTTAVAAWVQAKLEHRRLRRCGSSWLLLLLLGCACSHVTQAEHAQALRSRHWPSCCWLLLGHVRRRGCCRRQCSCRRGRRGRCGASSVRRLPGAAAASACTRGCRSNGGGCDSIRAASRWLARQHAAGAGRRSAQRPQAAGRC